MERRRYLLVDDDPGKLSSLENTVRSAAPHGSIIETTSSAREAETIIKVCGGEITDVVLDFDLLDGRNGTDVAHSLKQVNSSARMICVTARPEGQPLDDATADMIAAGVFETLCYLRHDVHDRLCAWMHQAA